MNLRKRAISIALTMTVILSMILVSTPKYAEAATTRITVNSFAKLLAKEIGLTSNTVNTADECIMALIEKGVIKEGEFDSYTDNLTIGDALVLINRADEYLYGDTLNADMVQRVIDKRISDINNISETKRQDIAKAYLKGYIKGYSNGYYIQNRKLTLTNQITKGGAINFIKRLKHSNLRAKISPDGMLIRTTSLPKNASSYEYILACYPNKFYERQFEFMIDDKYKDPRYSDYFGYPVEMKDKTFKNWYDEWPLSIEMDKHLYEWADMAEAYLQYVFNVDYRTVDDEWIEGLGSMYAKSNINEADDIRSYYIKHMKENHVIIESSIIAVEPSTFYEDGDYCMRAYVRYRITADDMSVKQNRIINVQYPSLKNLKSGKWRTGIFDIRFSTNNGSSGDGSDFAIDLMTNYVDDFNVSVK